MRITGCVVILFLAYANQASAQFTKMVPLKPIYKQGWKYFYDGKKLNTPFALQIPLQSLNNNEINERFRKFKKLQRFRFIAYLPSLVYLFSSIHYGGGHRGYSTKSVTTKTFVLLAAGGLAVDITVNSLSHNEMAKAIDIYNLQIAEKSTLGLSLNRLPNQSFLGLNYYFRF